MRHPIWLTSLLLFAPYSAFSQDRFALVVPDSAVMVTRDAQYATAGTTRLAMDVYSPATKPARRMPALVFFHRAVGAEQRGGAWPAGWGRAAASKGLVAIVADLRPGTEASDFDLLVAHLASRGVELGFDGLAVMAGSGNVSTAFPVVEDPKRASIKAAVMLYGSAAVTEFRLDLPVLLMRAGLDRPGVNQAIAELAALAVRQNAPVTLVNHPGGQHAFDVRDDDDASREMIERTLDFVVRATSATYQAALTGKLAEATAAGYVQSGKFREAAEAYANLVTARPEDAVVRLSYGEALLGDGQFAAACAEFEKLKGKRLGARDLGLPAARACLQKGDPDAAIAWLKTIPPRFLPAQLQQDPAFAALHNHADFKALFAVR